MQYCVHVCTCTQYVGDAVHAYSVSYVIKGAVTLDGCMGKYTVRGACFQMNLQLLNYSGHSDSQGSYWSVKMCDPIGWV